MRTDDRPDDEFDQFLRRELRHSAPYIADDGFTNRVGAALPRRRSMPLAPLVAMLLALVAVFVLVPWVQVAARVGATVLSLDWLALLELAAFGSLAMLGLAGLALARVARLL